MLSEDQKKVLPSRLLASIGLALSASVRALCLPNTREVHVLIASALGDITEDFIRQHDLTAAEVFASRASPGLCLLSQLDGVELNSRGGDA